MTASSGGLSRCASRLYEGPAFTCHHEAEEARLAHLIHRVAQEAEMVLVDTAGFGNRAATVAMTAADGVLIPMVPGEGDITEAARTVGGGHRVGRTARHPIPCGAEPGSVLDGAFEACRHRSCIPPQQLKASLSDLVAYGEMGFSGRMPTGKAGAEVAALMSELRSLRWLPANRLGVAARDLEDRPLPRRRGGQRAA